MTPIEWGLVVTLSVLWGGSFFFNQVAVQEWPTLTITVARVAIAAAALWLLIAATGRTMPRRPPVWAAFLAMGLLNNALPFSLIVWGQASVGSGVAAIMNAATPLFSVLIAHVATTDEKMTAGRILGVCLGILGVAVMVGGGVAAVAGHGLAYLACLAGAVSYAVAGVFGRRFSAMGVSPMATATGQVTASTVILAPFALVVDRPFALAPPSLETALSILAVALLSTALGYLIYFRVLATAGATNLLLVTLLVPVSALLLGVTILGEPLFARHLAGMGLIGLGLVTIDGRLFARLRRRTHRPPAP